MKRAGNLENALKHYKNAMDLEPDNSVFLYNTGVLFNIKHDYPEAIVHLEKSIEQNRENVYSYLALGDAYERQSELQKAIYVYRDLNSLGVNVMGLQEKIKELETKVKQQKYQEAKQMAMQLKQQQDAEEKARREAAAAAAQQQKEAQIAKQKADAIALKAQREADALQAQADKAAAIAKKKADAEAAQAAKDAEIAKQKAEALAVK